MSAVFYALATLKAKLGDKERGAGVVEYALVIGGISILLVLGAVVLNDNLEAFWGRVGGIIDGYAL